MRLSRRYVLPGLLACLRGEGRNIDRIEMIYLKNPTKPLPALMTVLGRIAT